MTTNGRGRGSAWGRKLRVARHTVRTFERDLARAEGDAYRQQIVRQRYEHAVTILVGDRLCSSSVNDLSHGYGLFAWPDLAGVAREPGRVIPGTERQNMSLSEAQDYVDVVVEKLVEWNIISPERYGKMNELQRTQLAELVQQKSEQNEN